MRKSALLLIGCLTLFSCTPEEIWIAEEFCHESEVALEAVEKDLGAQGLPPQPEPALGPNGAAPTDTKVIYNPHKQKVDKDANNARHRPKVILCSDPHKKALKECTKHGC